MFRETTTPAAESDADDRSMRIVEWAMAVIAVAAAGVLAFIR